MPPILNNKKRRVATSVPRYLVRRLSSWLLLTTVFTLGASKAAQAAGRFQAEIVPVPVTVSLAVNVSLHDSPRSARELRRPVVPEAKAPPLGRTGSGPSTRLPSAELGDCSQGPWARSRTKSRAEGGGARTGASPARRPPRRRRRASRTSNRRRRPAFRLASPG